MTTSLPAISVFVVCAALLAVIGKRLVAGQKGRAADARIVQLDRKPLLSAREAAMLAVIEDLFGHCRIHAQVAMGALIEVRAVPGRRRRAADRNAFAQKIVDFVVQGKQSGEVLILIEVDDRSHRAKADQARDVLTARAGYRTVRIPAGASASHAELRLLFAREGVESLIGRGGNPTVQERALTS